jgi:hypothetical protein
MLAAMFIGTRGNPKLSIYRNAALEKES